MKILVAWYGSFDRRGTLGDYLSAKALSTYLAAEGFRFACAGSRIYEELRGQTVRLDEITPRDYDTLVFCCGPVMKSNRTHQAFFDTFSHAYKIGVGVSLFPKDHSNYYNPFDYVLSRENTEKNYADIAIIAPKSSCSEGAANGRLTVGLVLRNKQVEYGAENCKSDLANNCLLTLAKDLTGKSGSLIERIRAWRTKRGRIVEIDNRLRNSEGMPEEIECEYMQCDLILTTRFHGAIVALRNNIPFIAIDQISGGAKVFKLLSRTGYPYVWKIDNVDFHELKDVATGLLQKKGSAMIEEAKSDSQKYALETLKELGVHLRDRLG